MIDGQHQGILPSQWIRSAIAKGIISSEVPFAKHQVQPNSLDLRLGNLAFRVGCSFLPGSKGLQRRLSQYKWYDLPIAETGTVLEREVVYLFRLCERLSLPDNVSARANPKSSTGRLDVFARLVTETGTAFDDVRSGYSGDLYLEVVPRSFAIRIRPGDSLAQIRFQVGDALLSDIDTKALLEAEDVIIGPDLKPLRSDNLRVSSGLFLSARVPDNDSTAAYKALHNTAPIDLREVGTVPIRQYWERIWGRPSTPIILEPGEFYILASRELVRLPPLYCAEMVPFDAGSGEMRTHYAGFFDSGFGYDQSLPAAQTAASVVLEIRNREVPFLIEEGHPFFRLLILRNAGQPDDLYGGRLGSNYQSQRLRLSKQFTVPDEDFGPNSTQAILPL